LDKREHPSDVVGTEALGDNSTSATSIAKYIRKWADFDGRNCPAKLAVVDTEDSVLFDWRLTGNDTLNIPTGSRIEGIGSSCPVVFGKTFSLLRQGVSRMFNRSSAVKKLSCSNYSLLCFEQFRFRWRRKYIDVPPLQEHYHDLLCPMQGAVLHYIHFFKDLCCAAF
jgi:hypothetical protein